MPVLIDLTAQPVHEAAGTLLVDVGEAFVSAEARERVGDQQPPVLAARAVVDDVVGAAAGVVVDPLQGVRVHGRTATARSLRGHAAHLDLARLAERRRRLPSLPPVLAIDRHPARAAPIGPGTEVQMSGAGI
jgi:hypothetical protein